VSLFESRDEMLSEVETTLRMECADAGHLKEPMLEAFIEQAGAMLAGLTSPGEASDRIAGIAGRLLPRPPGPDPRVVPVPLRREGEAIVRRVAARHGLDPDLLRGAGRTHAVCMARFEAMWTLYEARLPDGRRRFSLPQVGRLMGGRDHTTALHGVRRWETIMAERAGEGAARRVER
jgi:hypothetical protein